MIQVQYTGPSIVINDGRQMSRVVKGEVETFEEAYKTVGTTIVDDIKGIAFTVCDVEVIGETK